MENNEQMKVATRKKTILITLINIAFGLACVFYLWKVFIAQFTMQNSSSDKPWVVSNSLGCDFRKYADVPAEVDRRQDANIWFLQSHQTITYNSEILSDPKCLGARLADAATTSFDIAIVIYDKNRKQVVYKIRKYTN